MKRVILAVVSIFLLFGPVAGHAFAETYPSPVGYVNDFAAILSDTTISKLETQLALLRHDTSAQVAVVTVDNLSGDTIENYAAGLFKAWGIGNSAKDNGVLFIVSVEPRNVRIEVGYGLEPILTDGQTGRILDNEVIPYFKQGDYDSGVEAGVTAIEGYIRDGTPPSVVEDKPVQNLFYGFKVPMWILIVLGILSVYVLGFMARTKSIWLGGIWGVIWGIILGFGFGSLLWTILLPLILGFLGLGFDIVLSSNYNGRSSGGMSTGWFSSGGGFMGPGGGFGGFGGGGFGGFGGGGSGGGGASRGF